MATMQCPSCHERFRYDGREPLEELPGSEVTTSPDGPPMTYRSHDHVVHSCPINSA
jgi:hypothetical protein